MVKYGYQGKQEHYTYVCPWPDCGLEFDGYLPEDLENTMVVCPSCKKFLRKREYKNKKKIMGK